MPPPIIPGPPPIMPGPAPGPIAPPIMPGPAPGPIAPPIIPGPPPIMPGPAPGPGMPPPAGPPAPIIPGPPGRIPPGPPAAAAPPPPPVMVRVGFPNRSVIVSAGRPRRIPANWFSRASARRLTDRSSSAANATVRSTLAAGCAFRRQRAHCRVSRDCSSMAMIPASGHRAPFRNEERFRNVSVWSGEFRRFFPLFGPERAPLLRFFGTIARAAPLA